MKHFWCNLCCYGHIALSFDLGYIAGAYFMPKKFYEIDTCDQCDKTFYDRKL